MVIKRYGNRPNIYRDRQEKDSTAMGEIGKKRYDWLQGRTEKKYVDSMTIFLIAAMGILSTVFILTLINN